MSRASSSHKFLTVNGESTNRQDGQRSIWYSVSCGYWTDNWLELKSVGPGIPCCPNCHCVGMITTADDWFKGAKLHEQSGHPNYMMFLINNRSQCLAKSGGFRKSYEEYRKTLDAKLSTSSEDPPT